MYRVSEEHSNKKFLWYTKEDLKNEIWVIMLEIYGEYTPQKGPLENWLRVCVKNRLHNLYNSIKPKTTDPELAKTRNELLSVQDEVVERTQDSDTQVKLAQQERDEEIKLQLPKNVLFLVNKMERGEKLTGKQLKELQSYVDQNI